MAGNDEACVAISICMLVIALMVLNGSKRSPAADQSQWYRDARSVADFTDEPIPVVVKSPSGEVVGIRRANLSDSFHGIPYARAGRWQKAGRLSEPAWSGIFDARQPGHFCPQLLREALNVTLQNRGKLQDYSEDCFFLNIYRSARLGDMSDSKPLMPVMVWIHGGSFVHGAGSLYNGAALSLGVSDALVVTVNYRLGIFGFLQLSEAGNRLANFALTDLSEALFWIQRNIESFGGDPTRVTLFGESAGGALVGWMLLGSDLLPANMVKSAIMQSGTPTAQWAWRAAARATQDTDQLSEILQCKRYSIPERNSCLHSKTMAELLDAQNKLHAYMLKGFSRPAAEILVSPPVIDGVTIKHRPEHILQNSPIENIPVVIGVTQSEMTYFILFFRELMSEIEADSLSPDDRKAFILDRLSLLDIPEYRMNLPVEYHDVLNDLVVSLHEVEGNTSSVILQQLIDIWSDTMFACPALDMTWLLAKSGALVFNYLFAWEESPMPKWFGTPHTADLDFTFGGPLLGKPETIYDFMYSRKPYDNSSIAVSMEMMKWWTLVAHSRYALDVQMNYMLIVLPFIKV